MRRAIPSRALSLALLPALWSASAPALAAAPSNRTLVAAALRTLGQLMPDVRVGSRAATVTRFRPGRCQVDINLVANKPWCWHEPGARVAHISFETSSGKPVLQGIGTEVAGGRVWAKVRCSDEALARREPDGVARQALLCFLGEVLAPGVAVRQLKIGGDYPDEVFTDELLLDDGRRATITGIWRKNEQSGELELLLPSAHINDHR